MKSELEKLKEAEAVLKRAVPDFPKVVLVLGSGLSEALELKPIETTVSFESLPHFRSPSVAGHRGQIVVGSLGKVRVALLQGRLHLYEGFSPAEVVFPHRLFARAGANIFFLTNAAGSLSKALKPGSFVLIKDHINLVGINPLSGSVAKDLGPQFLDTSDLYTQSLRKIAKRCSKKTSVSLKEGVYIGLHGPSYETPAEVRMLGRLGGDMVGMSTVAEALAIGHMGKQVLAISCITNYTAGLTKERPSHVDVLESGRRSRDKFGRLVKAIVAGLPERVDGN